MKYVLCLTILLFAGFGCNQTSVSDTLEKEQITQESAQTTSSLVNQINPVIITYPVEGSIIKDNWNDVYVKGTATPGYSVWLFRGDDLSCITVNTFAAGGMGEVDANGNFSFQVAPTGLKQGLNKFIVSAFAPNTKLEYIGCFAKEFISNIVSFTFEGETNKQ